MKKILEVINGKKVKSPPVWFMRQAGRYLPEYMEIRSKKDNFLDLCYSPKLASEITLQPIKRFGFDAAIIFSDILVVIDALGVKVDFLKGVGPVVEKINTEKKLSKLNLNNINKHLSPVFDNISLTKSKLNKNTALIGFSGSPWTLATYLVEGGSSRMFNIVRKKSIENIDFFQNLINLIIESVTIYIDLQIQSGVEIIKLFDSWSGVLPEKEHYKWVVEPNRVIVEKIKQKYPNIPIIIFTRGSSILYKNIANIVNADVIAVDQHIPRWWVRDEIQKDCNKVIQGSLDNILLSTKSKFLEEEVNNIINDFGNYPFIFNLGHGVLPETPIDNINKVLNIIRS